MAEDGFSSGQAGAVRELDAALADELARQKERVRALWTDWAAGDLRGGDDGPSGSSKEGRKRARASSSSSGSSGSSGSRSLPLGGALVEPDELLSHIQQVRLGHDRHRVQVMVVLRRLMEDRRNRGIFNVPVDPVALNLPDYFSIITQPMDLGTVKRKVEQDQLSLAEVAADVRLVFCNAMRFNDGATYVHKTAKALLKTFNSEWAALEKSVAAEAARAAAHACDYCRGQACELCGQKCLQYQEPVLRCSAPCKARISRGASYYRLGGDRGQHWCGRCYAGLPERFLGILGQQVDKASLERCVNDQVFFEPWVDCARCERRLHQTCALYHPAIADPGAPFVCAICVGQDHGLEVPGFADKRKEAAAAPAAAPACPEKTSGSSSSSHSLPHTAMGRYLEDRAREVARRALGGGEEGAALAESLTVRVVSSCECVTQYAPRIQRWLTAQRRSCFASRLSPSGAWPGGGFENGEAFKDMPSSFPCRSKTVLLFQRIDGVDIMLFVLYVQEYGNDAPAPNTSKVYVSYLDSVAYLKPHEVRTALYQDVMVAYLTWVAARGFRHAYIWACPPQRGDAYIMYCHPKWQRTPGAERLRKWYAGIVGECKKDKVVLAETNFYEHHLSKFRPLLNTRSSRSSNSSRRPAPVAAQQLLSPRTSAELLRVDTKASDEPKPRLKVESAYDQLPYFYGDYLPNETEALLTLLLNSAAGHAACDEFVAAWWRTVWGPQTKAELLETKVESDEQQQAPPVTPVRKGKSVFDAGREAAPAQVLTPVVTPTWRLAPTSNLDQCDLTVGLLTPQQRNDWLMRKLAASIKPMSENFIVLTLGNPNNPTQQQQQQQQQHAVVVTTLGTTLLASDTSDPDPALPKGIFDTRLELLDMCKHNNFQFDELRRAKLSSLVLLSYHRKALRNALSKSAAKKPKH